MSFFGLGLRLTAVEIGKETTSVNRHVDPIVKRWKHYNHIHEAKSLRAANTAEDVIEAQLDELW